MRTRTKTVALALGLLVAGAWRLASAGDAAEEAFESPQVKEIAAKAEALKLDDRIALVRRVRRSIDAELLTPNESEWRGYESLRAKTDAGVARILQRGIAEGLVSPRGGGAYWSFNKRSNSYDEWPQLELQQWSFSTGFAGGDGGIVVRLPETDLLAIEQANVPAELKGEPEAAVAGGRAAERDSRKAEVGKCYAVRAVRWDDCDVLAVFKVVSMDTRGATIAWRILKTYDVPKQKR